VDTILKNKQYAKFCAYGFFKNLRFFEIFFILFLKEAGLSYLSIGLLYSIRQITINVMEIPSGIIADTFSRKRALLFAMGAYLISFVIFYLSRHFLLLSVAMIFYGLGEAFRSGTHKAIILNYLEENHLLHLKTRYYGSTRSWSQRGSALVSLLAAGFYYFGTGYRTLFLITIIPYLIDFILISSYPADHKKNGRNTDLSVLDMFKNTIADFIRFFKSAQTLRLLFSAASYTAFFKTSKDYLQPLLLALALQAPFLTEQNQETRSALLFGGVFFILYLLTAFSSKNAWKIEQHFSQSSTTVNLLYLVGVGGISLSGILLYFNFSGLAAAGFVFLYLVQNTRRPLMVSFMSGQINSGILASGLSAESQLETLLVAVFAPLFGILIDSFGLGGGLFAGSTAFLVLFPLARLRGLPV